MATMTMVAVAATVGAQSVDYPSLEKRFVKAEPEARDTVAFRTLGEQKVRQLFDKSHFFSQNYSSTSNQAYVKQQIPELFYMAPGDTLDVSELIRSIEQAKLSHGQSVELRTEPSEGYLGLTQTLNCEPKFTFYLVLMQIPKKFGDKQEMVWQVFLHKPDLQEVNLKKTQKK
jgi:hypothetical protein